MCIDVWGTNQYRGDLACGDSEKGHEQQETREQGAGNSRAIQPPLAKKEKGIQEILGPEHNNLSPS